MPSAATPEFNRKAGAAVAACSRVSTAITLDFSLAAIDRFLYLRKDGYRWKPKICTP